MHYALTKEVWLRAQTNCPSVCTCSSECDTTEQMKHLLTIIGFNLTEKYSHCHGAALFTSRGHSETHKQPLRAKSE